MPLDAERILRPLALISKNLYWILLHHLETRVRLAYLNCVPEVELKLKVPWTA